MSLRKMKNRYDRFFILADTLLYKVRFMIEFGGVDVRMLVLYNEVLVLPVITVGG